MQLQFPLFVTDWCYSWDVPNKHFDKVIEFKGEYALWNSFATPLYPFSFAGD